MTYKDQQKAIAEASGITVIPCTCTDNPWKDAETGKHLPDYLGDLNAIHKAKNKMLITKPQRRKFVTILRTDVLGYPHEDRNPNVYYGCIDAKAEEVCEAVIKTLNLWTV